MFAIREVYVTIINSNTYSDFICITKKEIEFMAFALLCYICVSCMGMKSSSQRDTRPSGIPLSNTTARNKTKNKY